MIEEENIEKVIKSLGEVFGPSKEAVAAMYNIIEETAPTNPADPEQFSATTIRFESVLDEASKHYIKSPDNADLRFLFTDYWFLKSHIEKLLNKKGEHGFEADKSGFILRKYQECLETGVKPNIEWNQDKYWIPRFGDTESWFKYLRSLRLLSLGYFEEYILALNDLLHYESRHFERAYTQETVVFKKDGRRIELPIGISLWCKDEYAYLSKLICRQIGVELPYKLVKETVCGDWLFGEYYEIPTSDFTTCVKSIRKTI